jgi:hypothetical protein
MTELKYSYIILQKICDENSIELCKDYSTEVVRQKTVIEAVCSKDDCLGLVKKSFYAFLINNLCVKCVKIEKYKKVKETNLNKYGVTNPKQIQSVKDSIISPIYNITKLEQFCNENKIVLINNYNNVNINQNTNIIGRCISNLCANNFNKKFRELVKTNGYCRNCTYKNAKLKRKESCLEKYGVESVMKDTLINQKCNKVTKYDYNLLQTFLQENPNIKLIKDYSNERISANYKLDFLCTNIICSQLVSREFWKLVKMRTLCMNCSRINAKEIRKYTNIKTIGCENYFQLNDIKEKIKQTNLTKYGVEYCIQNIEIAKKTLASGVRFKDYVFPSGRIEKIQGYEHFALDDLINIKLVNENDIVVGCQNVPIIWYKTDDGIQHRHYVDIFIPTQNLCIEVKSTWTIKFTKSNIFLKQNAAKELGYKYEIWVYNKKGGNINCYE